MMNRTLFCIVAAMPALATDFPPPIPDGPVEYTDVSYDTNYGGYDDPYATTNYTPAPAPAPMSASSSERRGYMNLNAYSSNYQVRGMGVTDALSKYGYSSVSASYKLPAHAFSAYGLQHHISGEYGVVWDASCPLGDTPVARLSYGLGKEIFPNLIAEVGYTFRHGGLEGFMARYFDGASHRATQELYASLTFNDYQKGFFGKIETGAAFYGLTGLYFDIEAGYRFTDVMMRGNMGVDMEISAGVAPSIGYWGSDVEGSDAYRFKLALLPYSQAGTFGRDAKAYVKPWVQCAWTGSNASKIDRVTDKSGIIDHFQITLGVDCGLNF
jgi:hypothetical protein